MRQSRLNEVRATAPRIGLYVETHVFIVTRVRLSRGVGWTRAPTWLGGRHAQGRVLAHGALLTASEGPGDSQVRVAMDTGS